MNQPSLSDLCWIKDNVWAVTLIIRDDCRKIKMTLSSYDVEFVNERRLGRHVKDADSRHKMAPQELVAFYLHVIISISTCQYLKGKAVETDPRAVKCDYAN